MAVWNISNFISCLISNNYVSTSQSHKSLKLIFLESDNENVANKQTTTKKDTLKTIREYYRTELMLHHFQIC